MGNSPYQTGRSFSDSSDETSIPAHGAYDNHDYYGHKTFPPLYKVADNKVSLRRFSGGNMSPVAAPTTIPTLFKWTRGGHQVQLTGSFDNWSKKIPLVESEDEFLVIIDLPAGEHQYKYLVDGVWTYDPDEPYVDNGLKSYNNVLHIKDTDFEVFKALAEDDSGAKTTSDGNVKDSSGFSQDLPPNLTAHHRPPALPPQLLQIVLNRETPVSVDPTILPAPQIAEINHLHALSIKGGVITMSSTHRYKKKYITTVFYQPT